MKKEGIQTRNRKLSSKSKKKKGMGGGCLPIGGHLGMSDLMKPLDPSKAFSGGFPGSMGKYFSSKSKTMFLSPISTVQFELKHHLQKRMTEKEKIVMLNTVIFIQNS